MFRTLCLSTGLLACLCGTAEAQRTRRPAKRPTSERALPHAAANERRIVIRPASRSSRHLPRLDERSLSKLLADRGTRVVTRSTMAEDFARHRKLAEERLAELARIARNERERLARLSRGHARDLRADAHTSFRDRRGRMRRVALLDHDALIRDILVTRDALQDRTVRLQTYSALHEAASKALGAEGHRRLASLPRPRDLSRASLPQVDGVITELVDLWITQFVWVDTGPPAYRPGCAGEEGNGYGGDRSAPGPGFDANGLFQNAAWPLEWSNTCVKDQGQRGTCAAFAVTAAAESLIAAQRNRWVNLSEQDLYKHMRLDWAPLPPDFYGDGFSPPVSLLFQIAGGYVFPWERDWDYNPSLARQADDATRTYTNSCDGYAGEACSDTNHQAAMQCYVTETRVVKQVVREVCNFVEGVPLLGILGSWVCDNVTETIESVEQVEVCVYDTNVPGTSGLRVNAFLPFYTPFVVDSQAGVDLARAHLAASLPVVFCFETVPSFDAATSNGGYVEFSGTDEVSRGGHCVLMSGYVANEGLPANVPQAQGGGWFVLKNSWGEDWGDNGYAYVSARWVRAWATQMTAITGIAGS